ncbi:helix-turn-helix domain-containing protein [Enterocloster lavalensis]|jgi:transcriptional regulator with XRE-family HTH domain|uniref:helix-turn-helix domain-containing protein n=1 Tax=Enterocloster lavalensis TaxID=460384 RepID=UPI000D19D374|nr:helix-turn-helix transcriptional regulator [Enterocloster lavalensis]PST30558.1 XRE family transcriptional regulator [Enterocloster lavalensis]
MIYETIKALSKEKGLSINQLEKTLGLSKGSLCRIDTNRPSIDRLQRIADFFDVSLDYLMTGKEDPEKKETKLTPKDERDIEKKLSETLDQIVNGDGLMFNGEIMDERTRQLLEVSLRSTMESAKIAAKKFTPNKYKK